MCARESPHIPKVKSPTYTDVVIKCSEKLFSNMKCSRTAMSWLLKSVVITGCKKSAPRSTGRTMVLTNVATLARSRKNKKKKMTTLDFKVREYRLAKLIQFRYEKQGPVSERNIEPKKSIVLPLFSAVKSDLAMP